MERLRTNKLVCSEWVAWVALGVAAFASFAVSGCGGDGSDEPSETPPGAPATEGDKPKPEPKDGCDAIDLEKPKPGEGMQVSIDMTLAPDQALVGAQDSYVTRKEDTLLDVGRDHDLGYSALMTVNSAARCINLFQYL